MAERVAAKIDSRRRLPVPAMRRYIRLAAELTQQDVAESLGVDRVTVARWESGRRTPRGQLLLDYLDLLDEMKNGTA